MIQFRLIESVPKDFGELKPKSKALQEIIERLNEQIYEYPEYGRPIDAKPLDFIIYEQVGDTYRMSLYSMVTFKKGIVYTFLYNIRQLFERLFAEP
jgi:hypothetical protein